MKKVINEEYSYEIDDYCSWAFRDLFHQEIFDSVNDELENGDELFTKIIEKSKFDECIKFINI